MFVLVPMTIPNNGVHHFVYDFILPFFAPSYQLVSASNIMLLGYHWCVIFVCLIKRLSVIPALIP